MPSSAIELFLIQMQRNQILFSFFIQLENYILFLTIKGQCINKILLFILDTEHISSHRRFWCRIVEGNIKPVFKRVTFIGKDIV